MILTVPQNPTLAAAWQRWTSRLAAWQTPKPAPVAPSGIPLEAASDSVIDHPALEVHDLAYYDGLANHVLTTTVSRAELATGLTQAYSGWKSLGVNVSTDRYLADYLARNSSLLSSAGFELTPTEYNWLHGADSGGSIQLIESYQAFKRAYPTLPIQTQGMSPALVHDITLGISAIPVVGQVAATAVNITEAAMSGGPVQVQLSQVSTPEIQLEGYIGDAVPAAQAPASSGLGGLALLLLLALVMD